MAEIQIFAKIARNAEAFWIRDIEETSPGHFRGIVDNNVIYQPDLKYGDVIEFTDAEVREIKQHPHLVLVG